MATACKKNEYWGPAVDLLTAAVNKTSVDPEPEFYEGIFIDPPVTPAILRKRLSDQIQIHDQQLVGDNMNVTKVTDD